MTDTQNIDWSNLQTSKKGLFQKNVTQRVYYYLGPPLCVVSTCVPPKLCNHESCAKKQLTYSFCKEWGETSQVFVDVAVIVTKCKILSGMANFLDGWNSDSDFEEADQTGEMKLCLFVEIQHRLCPFKLPSC